MYPTNVGVNSNGAVKKSPDATGTYISFGTIIFQVAKRTAPTITCYNPVTGSQTTPIRTADNLTNAACDRDAIGQRSFQANVSNVSIGAGAQMSFHFTADAEL